MKCILLLPALLLSAQMRGMDNPHATPNSTAQDLRSSLSSSSGSATQDNNEHNDFDYDNELEPGSPELPPEIKSSSKQERKEYKKRDNQELLRLARQMLAHDGNLNAALPSVRWSRNTLLTAAAEHTCHKNVLEFALANGANPNAVDKQGNTPLKVAVTSYAPENISLLLARGAQLNDQTLLGSVCNPFGIKQMNQKRIATLKVLLDAGANPNLAVVRPLYKREYTPCLLSLLLCNSEEKIEGDAYDAFVAHRKIMIDLLLEAKLTLFKEDEKGKTDWEKILECNTTHKAYNPDLVEFVQKQVTIRAHQYRYQLQP